MGKPFHSAFDGHITNMIPPIDVNGGKNGVVTSMKGYSHLSIILQLGVSAVQPVLTVQECDDFTPSNPAAIAFTYYSETTALGDTLSTKTAATSAGITLTANNTTFYVIEVDAAELTEGFPAVRIVLTDPSPAGSVIASAVGILSGGFGAEASATRIA